MAVFLWEERRKALLCFSSPSFFLLREQTKKTAPHLTRAIVVKRKEKERPSKRA
jgi:hypothetical protein